MKGGCKVYPNIGVKLDPRAITSPRMPESLKIYSGFLNYGYNYLMINGYCTKPDVDKINVRIDRLSSFENTRDKLKSSYWFRNDFYIIEFFKTNKTNFKIYALKIFFIEESRNIEFL